MINLDSPEIRQALFDVEILNNDRQWATLEILEYPGDVVVKLSYGPIHRNGMHERTITTRHYSYWAEKVYVNTMVHV